MEKSLKTPVSPAGLSKTRRSGLRIRGGGPAAFYWPALLVGCTLVALAVLAPEAERRLSVGRQCARMQAEVNVLKETQAQLQAAERALRRDPAYMERVARHELGITRPGEIRLRQPVTLSSEARGEPAPAEPAPPLALRALELSAGRTVRLVVLGAGGALLAAALFFGLSAGKAASLQASARRSGLRPAKAARA